MLPKSNFPSFLSSVSQVAPSFLTFLLMYSSLLFFLLLTFSPFVSTSAAHNLSETPHLYFSTNSVTSFLPFWPFSFQKPSRSSLILFLLFVLPLFTPLGSHSSPPTFPSFPCKSHTPHIIASVFLSLKATWAHISARRTFIHSLFSVFIPFVPL